jgi:polar amino acid transport system substrate-binding protein
VRRLFWLCCCWWLTAQAGPIEVKVGGYAFPPFVDVSTGEQVQGLALDLLTVMNRQQDRYRFRFVLTSPNRRFQDFAAGRFDMMLFEDQRWGWANEMMEATQPFLRDGDLFVTRQQGDRDQRYFAELHGKQIYAVRGYHYAFADYIADPDTLKTRFGVELLDPKASSLDRGLNQVAAGRAELMMITVSYLQHYFRQYPAMRAQLLAAEKWDSEYRHGALVRRQHPFRASDFDALMAQLRQSGEWQALTERYGVESLQLAAP